MSKKPAESEHIITPSIVTIALGEAIGGGHDIRKPPQQIVAIELPQDFHERGKATRAQLERAGIQFRTGTRNK